VLQPAHIESYYRQALEAGRKDDKTGKGGKLTAQTVLHHHRLLHTALGKAVKQRLIPWNPADAVDPPRPEPRQPAVLSEEEVESLLEALRGTELYIPVLGCGHGRKAGRNPGPALLDTYSHVVPTMQEEAVELLDRRLGRQENGAKKPAHE
jgi:integrase